MAYTPSGHGCGSAHLSAIQLEGIKSLIKNWCGVDIFLIDAGPSVSDPCGLYNYYISLRDSHGNAIAVGITPDGRMETPKIHRGNLSANAPIDSL